jgi:hypothetical protein
MAQHLPAGAATDEPDHADRVAARIDDEREARQLPRDHRSPDTRECTLPYTKSSRDGTTTTVTPTVAPVCEYYTWPS